MKTKQMKEMALTIDPINIDQLRAKIIDELRNVKGLSIESIKDGINEYVIVSW